MHKVGVKGYKYYVGINSLAEIATTKDRVCVLNILGNESRQVSPISHEYSNGNIVFGTGPGRVGQSLETQIGDIPVYNSIREGLAAGHKFNTGVVYLPPAGVKDGVSEMVRQNPELKKVIIITEKVSVKDSRTIRSICQINGVDVFGGNCLGVADAWNHVRLGGALGGSAPGESLVKGSVAVYSNSGNFTTTIATYILTRGWGTTTSISSGKDVYIHFAAQEFFHALDNDDRSRAAVIYIEPGGYYEHQLNITKPTVACIVGRWKAKLNRACGHAGSLAGTGDSAAAKEQWFMKYFGVDSIYTPENPIVSQKGAVVTNISYIPAALTRVMELNGITPDFEPRGNLSLKCWFSNNRGLSLPPQLDIATADAMPPYNVEINILELRIGAQYPRQTLKDTSGASVMDPKTQVSRLYNHSILEASGHSLEENLLLALLKSFPGPSQRNLANIVFHAHLNLFEDAMLTASDAARNSGSSPNCVLSAALGILGKGRAAQSQSILGLLLERFRNQNLLTGHENPDISEILKNLNEKEKQGMRRKTEDPLAAAMLQAIAKKEEKSVFLDFVFEATRGDPSSDALFAAIWATIGWPALMNKRISQTSFLNLPWYSKILSAMVGCSVPASKHKPDSFCGIQHQELMENWSFSETAFLSLVGRRPSPEELFEWNLLLGLIITNGPGTISAQGCKGGVSSDGPEDPGRVQINKAFIAFLTHTGFAHGGNGFEAMEFLMEQFKDVKIQDPGNPGHGVDLEQKTMNYARWYGDYKRNEKRTGNLDYKKIPCINHPVFKGKDINYDPRTQYVNKVLRERGSYNLFLDYYEHLVHSLYRTRVSKNVYCVNVDAVIATILLKIFWQPLKNKQISALEVETAAFTAFLYGRMIGCAAEIDDHLNRGKNMDTRTPASRCFFIT